MRSDLVLVAHGTRNAAGLRTIGEIAAGLSCSVGPVRTSFVDVLGPNPRELLAEAAQQASRPAIVVPAFLASGYHVKTDLPARIVESGHPAVVVTRSMGPDPVLADVMRIRLIEAGWRHGDGLVMAAAGSSDPVAIGDLTRAAAMLADCVGVPVAKVPLGFVATGAPKVAEVVEKLRNSGRRRVFIASYLLAPGVFHNKLSECGATGVADPLGAHPAVIALLAKRFVTARLSSRRVAIEGAR